MKLSSHAFGIILVLILSFWAIKPLFLLGYFPMHDDTQPARIYEMAKAISYFQIPVRLVSDLGYGYGYMLFNFYAPLPYYIGAVFNLVGFDVIVSAKIMFMIGILLSGISMYLLVTEIAGIEAAIVSSILYVYAPYHAVDIYVRGAVGEYYTLVFLPIYILGIMKIINFTGFKENHYIRTIHSKKLVIKDKFVQTKNGMILSSLGLSGILLSHNILGLIILYFSFSILSFYLIYLLYKKADLTKFLYILFSVILGISLSAFFIFPAAFEKKYTNVDTLITNGSDYRLHFVYPDQLWNSPWGYGGSAPGRADGMSFKLGKIHVLLGIISIFYFIYLTKKRKKIISQENETFWIFKFLIIITISSIFLTLETSAIIWRILPGFPYIQYPWRFLAIIIFSLSVLSSVLFLRLNKLIRIVISFIIIILTLWLNIKYFNPQKIIDAKPWDYTDDVSLRYKISKISDEYLPSNFISPVNSSDVRLLKVWLNPDLSQVNQEVTPTMIRFVLNAKEETNLLAHLAYYPGWVAELDGKIDLVIKNVSGQVSLDIPQGRHTLKMKFTDTSIRTLSNTISFLAIFLLVYVSLFWDGKKPWYRKIRLK